MRISKRIASAALAGVLACSLAAAPFAMAAEGGLLSGMTGAEATPAVEVATYETHTYGQVAVQMPAEWDVYEEAFEGEAYATLETDTAMMQVMCTPENLIGFEEELVAQGVAELQAMMADYTEAVNETFILDGIMFRNIVATGSYEGVPIEGYSSFVFGEDFTFVMLTVQFDAGNGFDPAFARAHATLGLVPAGAQDTDVIEPETDPVPPVAPVEPVAPVTPAEPTTEPAASTEAVEFVCEGWTLASAGEATLVTVENEWSDYNGMQAVAIPMTLTNTTGEASDPWLLTLTAFGADGIESDNIGYDFDDSVENVGSMRPNASTQINLYVLYNGEGTYTVQFTDWYADAEFFVTATIGEPTVMPAAPAGGFVCDGWTIVPGEGYIWGVVEDEWSDYNGMEVVGVPMTVYNGSGEITSPWWDLDVVWYGSKGLQVESPDYDCPDSFKELGNMLPGAQAECYTYFVYDGDGEYAVAFEGWDDDSYNEIVINVAK